MSTDPTAPREVGSLGEAFRLVAFQGILDNGPGRTPIAQAADLAADAILATPEMQAIKQALLCFASNAEDEWALPSTRAVLEVVDGCCLPQSVVQWLLA